MDFNQLSLFLYFNGGRSGGGSGVSTSGGSNSGSCSIVVVVVVVTSFTLTRSNTNLHCLYLFLHIKYGEPLSFLPKGYCSHQLMDVAKPEKIINGKMAKILTS